MYEGLKIQFWIFIAMKGNRLMLQVKFSTSFGVGIPLFLALSPFGSPFSATIIIVWRISDFDLIIFVKKILEIWIWVSSLVVGIRNFLGK